MICGDGLLNGISIAALRTTSFTYMFAVAMKLNAVHSLARMTGGLEMPIFWVKGFRQSSTILQPCPWSQHPAMCQPHLRNVDLRNAELRNADDDSANERGFYGICCPPAWTAHQLLGYINEGDLKVWKS